MNLIMEQSMNLLWKNMPMRGDVIQAGVYIPMQLQQSNKGGSKLLQPGTARHRPLSFNAEGFNLQVYH